jgi:hypothetical protein
VTSASSGLGNKGSSSADEGVVTSSSNDNESLASLDSGGSIAVVTSVLVDSERLASDGRLIDLNEAALGNETTISRDDGSLFNLENITGNDLGGLDLLESTVTEDNSLKSQSFLEFFDDRTCLELLDETNTSVEQEKRTNDAKVYPVLKTGSENSSSFLLVVSYHGHEIWLRNGRVMPVFRSCKWKLPK